jgi:hypothetical protein
MESFLTFDSFVKQAREYVYNQVDSIHSARIEMMNCGKRWEKV